MNEAAVLFIERARRTRVLDCRTCAKLKDGELAPPHDASERCESGKHTHCSCDQCF